MTELEEYIRANRDRFSREALTRQLVEGGHDPVAVEAAWRTLDADRPKRSERRPGVGTVLLVILMAAAYALVAYFGVVGIAFSSYYGGGEPGPPVGSVVPGALIVVYLVGTVIGLAYSGRRLVRTSSGRNGDATIAGAFAIAVVVLFGINGLCIAGTVAASSLGALR